MPRWTHWIKNDSSELRISGEICKIDVIKEVNLKSTKYIVLVKLAVISCSLMLTTHFTIWLRSEFWRVWYSIDMNVQTFKILMIELLKKYKKKWGIANILDEIKVKPALNLSDVRHILWLDLKPVWPLLWLEEFHTMHQIFKKNWVFVSLLRPSIVKFTSV